MKVALGQFAVDREWQQNATTITEFMSAAQQNGADLLVLPEGVLARDITNPNMCSLLLSRLMARLCRNCWKPAKATT